MTRIGAICTDGDGTLWDSEEMLFQVYTEMLAARGCAFTLEDYRAVVGRSSERATEITLARFGLDEDHTAFIAERRRNTSARLGTVRPMPGAVVFLEKAAAAGIPLVLVSSAVMAHVGALLDSLGLRRFFAALVVGDTPELGGKHKPEPEPYLLGARLAGVDPARCLGVEDTRHGALSAYRAGMIVVAAPHRFSPRENFTSDLAHHVIPEGKTLGDFDLSEVDHLLPP